MHAETRPTCRKSSLCLAIGLALGTSLAQATDVGDESALIAAINASEPVITLTSDITLTGSLPPLEVGTTIQGAGFTISGAGNACLETYAQSLSVNNLTLTGCSNSAGGAILAVFANATVTNSTLSGNTATSGNGGGISVIDGNLELIDSSVTGNTASDGGGGVSVKYGNLSVSNTTISDNNARVGGGVYASQYAYLIDGRTVGTRGGFASELEFQGAVISGNTAESSDRDAFGGGIAAEGFDLLRIVDSTISGNTAIDETGYAYGGGVASFGRQVEITGSTVIDNVAIGQPPNGQQPESMRGRTFGSGSTRQLLGELRNRQARDIDVNLAFGGGLILEVKYGATVSETTIAGNETGYLGGGLFAIGPLALLESTVSGNTAPVAGGLFTTKYSLIDSSTISGNNASYIGGLSTKYGAVIENSTISGNTAEFDIGGALLSSASSMRFSTVTNNSAGGQAGGILVDTEENGPRGNSGFFGLVLSGNSAETDPDLVLEGSLELDISYSVIGVIPDGFVPGTGTLVGVNPLLGSLADNGGPTQTHLPANNSPAGALVPLESCDLDADQRGTPRPIGEGCSVCPLPLNWCHA